jgi:hypothetical protein
MPALRRRIVSWLPPRLANAGRRVSLVLMPARWRVARLVSLPLCAGVPEPARRVIIGATRFVWGNASYSASRDLLTTVSSLADGKRHIVELGAGLTTLVLRRRPGGGCLISLEHDREWATRLLSALPIRAGDEISIARLIEVSEGVDWYQIDPALVEDADLIICDGPPGQTTRGGRFGLLWLLDRVRGPVTVVIDDVNRRDERNLADALLSRPGARAADLPGSSRFAVIELPRRSGA